MPPKTCEVVTKPNQRGARIHPRGCKVRRVQQADGSIKKYNKEGKEKAKITYAHDRHGRNIAYVWVAVSHPNTGNVQHARGVRMTWDTGATSTMMRYEDAEAWGVINQPNGRARPFNQSRSLDARGTMSQVRVYKDVPFVVKWRNIEEAVRDDILVHPPPVDGANLLGTRTMRKLKQLKMKTN